MCWFGVARGPIWRPESCSLATIKLQNCAKKLPNVSSEIFVETYMWSC